MMHLLIEIRHRLSVVCEALAEALKPEGWHWNPVSKKWIRMAPEEQGHSDD